jgi:hypothetical protein
LIFCAPLVDCLKFDPVVLDLIPMQENNFLSIFGIFVENFCKFIDIVACKHGGESIQNIGLNVRLKFCC